MRIEHITSVIDKPEVFKKIIQEMEMLENQALHHTGIKYTSGSFAIAELFNYDDNYADIQLKWGIQSDCQNVVHTELYKLNLHTFEMEDS